MAKLERGKGLGKHVIELTRCGPVLVLRQTEGEHRNLTGFRRCASAAAAQAELAREVGALLADRMRPADAEARSIARSAAPTRKSNAPRGPLRCDLGIFNEANGFVITSRRMAGKPIEEGSAAWRKAVAKGDLLPISLKQDDPIVVRIVLGGPLSKAEEAAWLARIDSMLDVRDGKLCITGGSVFAQAEYDADDPHYERYVAELPIPKSRYRAALHVLALDEADERDAEREPVDFLLHLTPTDSSGDDGLSELPRDGWFSGEENARDANEPRTAIHATEVVRRLEGAPGHWTFAREPFSDLAGCEPPALQHGALELGLDAIAGAARLAWLRCTHAAFELRLQTRGSTPLAASWPDDVIAIEEDGIVRLLFDADASLDALLPSLESLAARIAGLAEGASLDFCASARERASDEPIEAARLWLRGSVSRGQWTIAAAHPAVDGPTLRDALAFSSEVNRGMPIPEARATFAERFARAFPMAEAALLEEDWDDEEAPPKPIVGAKILASPTRTWSQTMALLLSDEVEAKTNGVERELRRAGYRHVGDLVCDAFDTIAFRGYVSPQGDGWAITRAEAPDRVDLEIVTRFAGGASLLTSAQSRNVTAPQMIHQTLSGASPPALIAAHHERVAALSADHGVPATAVAKLFSLAELLDGVLFPSG